MSTNIQWCDETINPIVGCSRISPGCQKCYAATAAQSARLQRFPQYQAVSKWDGSVEFVESQLLKPLSWKKPKRIFVCSMSDLFHENVPDEWIDKVMAVIALSSQHTFQVLTKRPHRAKEYFSQTDLPNRWYQSAIDFLWQAVEKDFGGLINLQTYFMNRPYPLPNLWLGTTVENQDLANQRIPILLEIPAVVRWLSLEPLLGDIKLDFTNYVDDWNTSVDIGCHKVSWVVVGGESGRNARPCAIGWLTSVVQQCHSANIPVFVKQLGSNCVVLPGLSFGYSDRKGGDIAEFPPHLQIRQFPQV